MTNSTCRLSIFIVLSACGPQAAGNTPTLGDWKLTALTGQIQRDYLVCGVGSTTFVPSVLSTPWNRIKVTHTGSMSYSLAFDNAGDSYNIGGEATATSGAVTGNTTSPADGLTLTATGSYDGSTMNVTWSYRQHVENSTCVTDVKGDGTFTASPP